MRIQLSKAGAGFMLDVGGTQVTLSKQDLKLLLVQAVQALSGGGGLSADAEIRNVLSTVQKAEDVAIQGLLRTAEHDDVLMLLKAAERDDSARKKLYGNMSKNARQMYREDLQHRFKDDLPATELQAAMIRVAAAMSALATDRTATANP